MDPLQRVQATFQILNAKNGGLSVQQLSALVLNSTKCFDFSRSLQNSEVERLLELWLLLLDAQTILSPSFSSSLPIKNNGIQARLSENRNIAMESSAFDVMFNILSRIFCIRSEDAIKSKIVAKSQNQSFRYPAVVRCKAIALWNSLLSRTVLVLCSQKQSSLESSTQIVSIDLKKHLSEPKKLNLIAYCVCGLLDNVTETDEVELADSALSALSTLLHTSQHHNVLDTYERNNAGQAPLECDDTNDGVLSDPQVLSQLFPGIVSSLIKIALSNLSFRSVNGNSSRTLADNSIKIKDKTRSLCLSLLRKAINICFAVPSYKYSDLGDEKLVQENNGISVAKSWARFSSLKNSKRARSKLNIPLISEKEERLANHAEGFNNSCRLWTSDAAEKLQVGLQKLLILRNSKNNRVKLELVRLYSDVIINCWPKIYEFIPFALQTLLLAQTSPVPEIHEISAAALNVFCQSITRDDYKNIVVILHGDILSWFSQIFDKFSQFISPMDSSVSGEAFTLLTNYLNFLDRLISTPSTVYKHSLVHVGQELNQVIYDSWEATVIPSLVTFVSNELSKHNLYFHGHSIGKAVMVLSERNQKGTTENNNQSFMPLKMFLLSIANIIGVEYVFSSIFFAFLSSNVSKNRASYLYLIYLTLSIQPSQEVKHSLEVTITSAKGPKCAQNSSSLLNELNVSTLSVAFESLINEIVSFVDADSKQDAIFQRERTLSVSSRDIAYEDSVLIATSLNVLRMIIIYKKSEIYYYLEELLFPLLALTQFNSAIIKDSANACLLAIIQATNALSLSNLLLENADYIVNACSSRIREFDFTNDVFLVLTTTISSLVPSEAINLTSDIVEDVIQALELIYTNGLLTSFNTPNIFSETTSGLIEYKDKHALNHGASDVPVNSPAQAVIKCLDFFEILTRKIRDSTVFHNEIVENCQSSPLNLFKERFKSRKPLEKQDTEGYTFNKMGDSKLQQSENFVESEEKETPISNAQKACIKIMMTVKNFISHSNAHAQIRSIKILQNVLPCLTNSKELLPLVNEVWPLIARSFSVGLENNSDKFYITLSALQLVSDISLYSGDWLRSRILKDVWPNFSRFLRLLLQPSKRSLLESPLNNTNIQLALRFITTLGDISSYVLLSDKVAFELACLLVHFFDSKFHKLVKDAALSTMEMIAKSYADLVWLVCSSFNDLKLEAQNSEQQIIEFRTLSQLTGCSAIRTFSLRKLAVDGLYFTNLV